MNARLDKITDTTKITPKKLSQKSAQSQPASAARGKRSVASLIARSLVAALGITALAALFVVPKLKTTTDDVAVRWHNIPVVFVIGLALALVYGYLMERRSVSLGAGEKWIHNALHSRAFAFSVAALCAVLVVLPFLVGPYHTRILTLVFIYVIFSLGLNVVVGLAGMLCLGQAFFLGAGAYTYALLNVRAGVDFYVGLPAGAVAGALAGLIFSLATLRLRGDYLAIVTLGLSEIFRLVMTNLNFTGGPRGITGIEKPGLFGMELSYFGQTRVLYFIAFALVAVSMLMVRRMEKSRFGRAWESLREDEIASSAMGINTASVRIGVFVLGGILGGVAGVLFAANSSVIAPGSFSILVSVTALCIAVLGGLGSISGVVLGAAVLVMLPEYLRFFLQYRMLVFGGILVFMMLFRPSGIIPKSRTEFLIEEKGDTAHAARR